MKRVETGFVPPLKKTNVGKSFKVLESQFPHFKKGGINIFAAHCDIFLRPSCDNGYTCALTIVKL